MSQFTHPNLALPQHGHPRRALWVGAILAMTVVGAVVLILALGGGNSSPDVVPASVQTQVGARADGGPEETGVAAAIGSRPAARPDEGTVAAAIGSRPAARPDEGTVAAAIGRR